VFFKSLQPCFSMIGHRIKQNPVHVKKNALKLKRLFKVRVKLLIAVSISDRLAIS
jgi:hypothetical protein